MAKSKRTKACDISDNVKREVWERDGGVCVICRIRPGSPNMHYVRRSDGGLGIKENVCCGCYICHNEYDNGYNKDINLREHHGQIIKKYLNECYPDFKDEDRYYKKWEF